MKCAIIANGNISDYNYCKTLLTDMDYIICVDGGANHLFKMKLTPNVIIGDLDSIDYEAKEFFLKKGIEFHRFPTSKDATDTELAVDFALSLKPSEIIFFSTLGSRMDHSIANITLLKKTLDNGTKGRVINENNEIYILNDTMNEIILPRGKNEYLSIIPLSKKVKGVTLDGVKYPLNDVEIPFGSSLGISNEFKNDKAEIKIKKGILLVIKAKD